MNGKEKFEEPQPEELELKDEEYDDSGEEGDNEVVGVPKLSLVDGL